MSDLGEILYAAESALADALRTGSAEERPMAEAAYSGVAAYRSVINPWPLAQPSPDYTRGRQDGWLPIESAPKDGTAILAASILPRGYADTFAVVAWDDDGSVQGNPAAGEGWNWYSDRGDSQFRHDSFTHWRPLPEPPIRAAADSPAPPADGRA